MQAAVSHGCVAEYHISVPLADPSGRGSLEPTSPRSVEACLRLGIEPSELHFMPMDVFLARFKESDLAEIAYSHHETVRQVSSNQRLPSPCLSNIVTWCHEVRLYTHATQTGRYCRNLLPANAMKAGRAAATIAILA